MWMPISSVPTSKPLNITAGVEDPSDTEEDRAVLRNVWLCQEDPPEGGSEGILQGLHPQYSGHHSLCWHRSGSVRGQWRSLSLARNHVFLLLWFFVQSNLLLLTQTSSPVRAWRTCGCPTTLKTQPTPAFWCCSVVGPYPAPVARWPATLWLWFAPGCRHKVERTRPHFGFSHLTWISVQLILSSVASHFCFDR